MATETTSPRHPPTGAPAPSARTRRRRPRWWMILLAAVAAIAITVVVVIQLLPNPADGPAVVGATRVSLRDDRFHPAVIQIKPGQTVTWSLDDNGTTHNIKGDGWGSGNQASGTFRHTFTTPGSYRYSCTLHVGMNGRVDVVAGGATP
jgi:plastocyanin